jgi:adenine-specific DNA glycosylase
MLEFPSTPWIARKTMPVLAKSLGHAPAPAPWQLLPGSATHTFTHFHFEAAVAVAGPLPDASKIDGEDVRWLGLNALGQAALPTAMAKIAQHRLSHGAGG